MGDTTGRDDKFDVDQEIAWVREEIESDEGVQCSSDACAFFADRIRGNRETLDDLLDIKNNDKSEGKSVTTATADGPRFDSRYSRAETIKGNEENDMSKKENADTKKSLETNVGEPEVEPCGCPDDNDQGDATVEKTLSNSDISGTRINVPDVEIVGNGDLFQLLCKASSKREGWMKSAKAMQVPNGCVVQVTTQQRNPDGGYSVAEALVWVPNVKIVRDDNGGRKLVYSAG